MAKPLCCLALDVGNTTTRFALFASDAAASDEPLGTWELTTPESLTPDEARMHIAQVLGVLAQDVARARELAGDDGVTLICGSLYLAGDMRLLLNDDGGRI